MLNLFFALLGFLFVTRPTYADAPASRYEDVKAIIDSNCIMCHNPNGPAGFLPFTTLDEIKGNHQAMANMLSQGYMPQGNPGFKDTPDGKTLMRWLTTGVDLGNQPPPVEPPPLIMRDPRTLVYEDIKPMIDRHCVGCHNPQGRAGNDPFTSKELVLPAASKMFKRLDSGRMPDGNPEFRFTVEGRTLLGWMRYGADLNDLPPTEDDD